MTDIAASIAIEVLSLLCLEKSGKEEEIIKFVIDHLDEQKEILPSHISNIILRKLSEKRKDHGRITTFQSFLYEAEKRIPNKKMAQLIATMAFGYHSRCFFSLTLNVIRRSLEHGSTSALQGAHLERNSETFSQDSEGVQQFIQMCSKFLHFESEYHAVEIILDLPNLEIIEELTEFEILMIHAQQHENYHPWGPFFLREDHIRFEKCLEEGKKVLRIHQAWPRIGILQNIINSSGKTAEKKIETITNVLEKAKSYYDSNNIFIVGMSGQGKSTLSNTLAERLYFHESEVGVGTTICKRKLASEESEISKALNGNVNLWDTPGINESEERDRFYLKNLENVLTICGKARAMIIVFKEGQRCTERHMDICMRYIELWGVKHLRNIIILLNEIKSDTSQPIKARQKIMWAGKLNKRLVSYSFPTGNIVHCNVSNKISQKIPLISKLSKFDLIIPEISEKVYRKIMLINKVKNSEERKKHEERILLHSNNLLSNISQKLEKYKVKIIESKQGLKLQYEEKLFSRLLQKKTIIQSDVINVQDSPQNIVTLFKLSILRKVFAMNIFSEFKKKRIALIKIGGNRLECRYEMFPIQHEVSKRVLQGIASYLEDPDLKMYLSILMED